MSPCERAPAFKPTMAPFQSKLTHESNPRCAPQEMGITLPAPCACGHGLSPLDEKYCERCCNNCTFYHDPEALSYALGHLLHAFHVVPADFTL
jgi:hypothetical protein